jgi:hypothetical protein
MNPLDTLCVSYLTDESVCLLSDSYPDYVASALGVLHRVDLGSVFDVSEIQVPPSSGLK